jgi:hypothetical protein
MAKKDESETGEPKPIGKWIGLGVGAGIGSAAIAAALIYGNRAKKQEKKPKGPKED